MEIRSAIVLGTHQVETLVPAPVGNQEEGGDDLGIAATKHQLRSIHALRTGPFVRSEPNRWATLTATQRAERRA